MKYIQVTIANKPKFIRTSNSAWWFNGEVETHIIKMDEEEYIEAMNNDSDVQGIPTKTIVMAEFLD